jgi:hypothetical protein
MGHIFSDTPLGAMLERGKRISEDQLFVEIISNGITRKFIAKLNTDQMKIEFVNSEGIKLSEIGGGYANSTVQNSGKSGKFNVNLFDTGEFHQSFRVEDITGRGFEINSDHVKDDGTDLFIRWGEEVEGLTFESITKAAKFLVNLYQIRIRKELIG